VLWKKMKEIKGKEKINAQLRELLRLRPVGLVIKRIN